jgi:hypothetical protein
MGLSVGERLAEGKLAAGPLGWESLVVTAPPESPQGQEYGPGGGLVRRTAHQVLESRDRRRPRGQAR